MRHTVVVACRSGTYRNGRNGTYAMEPGRNGRNGMQWQNRDPMAKPGCNGRTGTQWQKRMAEPGYKDAVAEPGRTQTQIESNYSLNDELNVNVDLFH